MSAIAGVFLVAVLISLCVTPAVRRLALYLDIVDRPNQRKVHREPIPRLGGLAIYLAWLGALLITMVLPGTQGVLWSLFPLAALGAGVVILGLWDDWEELSGKAKLLGQIVIASLVFWIGIRIDRLSNPFGGEFLFPLPLSYLVTVLWIIGMMNALNLIDGLDGLACGVAGIAAAVLITTGLYLGSHAAVIVLAAVAGACLGFLRYNFHPAKIFLGDSGSQFLGFVFATAALVDNHYKVATAVSLLVPLTALTLPIYDTVLAVRRRVQGHHSIFRADKYHLHHRLLKMGLSQRQVVFFLYLISGYLGCLAFLFVLIPERYALVLLVLLVLGLLMAMQTLRFLEFRLRKRSRRRAQMAANKG